MYSRFMSSRSMSFSFATRRRFTASLVAAVAFLSLSVFAPQPALAQGKGITVFAAASMKNALDGANEAFTKATGIPVIVSYAASSALAKQIEQGAPADVFISADLAWMDHLDKLKAIQTGTRVNLLGNKLVLIAPKDSKLGEVKIAKDFDLAKLAGDGRIATGEVTSVPVGRYAKEALQNLGAWDAAASKFAMADNVRAALLLVSRGEAALGIVYSTDAKADQGVRVIGIFPDGSHEPVVYPVALTKDASADAKEYLAFLQTKAAAAIFESHGFSVLSKPAS